MAVLVAARHWARSTVEILGVALNAEDPVALDRLMEECERAAYEVWVPVRRLYGDPMSKEEFARKLVTWHRCEPKPRDPTITYFNTADCHYWIERREPLC